MAVLEIGGSEQEDQNGWQKCETEDSGDGTRQTEEFRSDENGHIHLIRPGEDAAHRENAQKLLFAHPFLLHDHNLSRPGREPTAEGGQRDVVESECQLRKRGARLCSVTHDSARDRVGSRPRGVERGPADPVRRSGATPPSRGGKFRSVWKRSRAG